MRDEKRRSNGELDFEIYHFVFETVSEMSREIAEAARKFPKEKLYLTDLACIHSSLVCVNLEEAWSLKEQGFSFLDKLSDAAQAASRTQDVLKLALKNNYIDRDVFRKIDSQYDKIFEDMFTMLCNGKKLATREKSNGSRPAANKKLPLLAGRLAVQQAS